MITKEQVTPIVNEALADSDRFLVEVKVKPSNVIEVYVDSDTAVTIDHCVEISRYIQDKLDRDVEDYELSVMSYGLSGALRMDRQLNKYVGKLVEVKSKESGKMQGTLLRFDSEKVEVEPVAKKASKKNPQPEGPLVFERKLVELKPAIVF